MLSALTALPPAPPPVPSPARRPLRGVGARVVIETPGGSIASARVVEIEQRASCVLPTVDTTTVLTDRMVAPAGERGLAYLPAEHRVELRLRLDSDSLWLDDLRTAAAPVAANSTEPRVCDRALERMAAAAGRRIIQTQEQNMASMLAASTSQSGVYTANVLADGGTLAAGAVYATTGASTTSFATTDDIVGTLLRLREQFPAAASPPTASRVWFSGTEGDIWPVEATSTTWTWSATGSTDVRVVANYVRYNDSGDWDTGVWRSSKTPEDRLREMIRARTGPTVLRHRDPHNSPTRPGVAATEDFREMRARETLAKLIGEERFRRFLRDGFVSCRAKSGRTYQIFPGGNFTRVFQDGKELPRLCVVLRGNFPATDSLIVRYLMVLNDEEGFRKLAINQGLSVARRTSERHDERPLADLYAGYKRERDPFDSVRRTNREEEMAVAS